MRTELIQIKDEKISGQDQLSQENNQLKTKIFLLEQDIIKKNNIIALIRQKIEKKSNTNIFNITNKNNKSAINVNNKIENIFNYRSDYINQDQQIRSRSNYSRNTKKTKNSNSKSINTNKSIDVKTDQSNLSENNDVYILAPTQAMVKLNNELLYYKESYDKLLTSMKRKQLSLKKYENLANKLETENSNLKKRYKVKLMQINNEKENMKTLMTHTYMSCLDENNYIDNNMKKKLVLKKKLNHTHSSTNENFSNKNTNSNFTNPNLTSEKKFQQNEIIGKEYTMEEFGAILKNVGLTREIFDSLSRIKGFEKLTDAIEFFFKLVKEKNEQILILEKEIEELNYKNFDLNKKNMELEEKLFKNNKKTENNFDLNDSMTIQNSDNENENKKKLNIKNYKLLLDKQKEDEELKQANFLYQLNLSTEKDASNGIKKSKKDKINYNNENSKRVNDSETNKNKNIKDSDDNYEDEEDEEYEEEEEESEENEKNLKTNKKNDENGKSNNKDFDTLNSVDFRKGVTEEVKRQEKEQEMDPNKITMTLPDS